MERIYPITESSCLSHIGRPICAVLQDGTRYYGVLEQVKDGQIILNGYLVGGGTAGISSRPNALSKKKGKRKAKTSAFYPGIGGFGGFGGLGGFGFSRFFFPFATLSFLFLLPFLASPFFW